jgi:hypothetical protein
MMLTSDVIHTYSCISVSAQFERELHSAMARVQNPILFSAFFGVPSQALAAAGLIDPFLDVDVPLFIDPVLLEKSSNKTINTTAIVGVADDRCRVVREDAGHRREVADVAIDDAE